MSDCKSDYGSSILPFASNNCVEVKCKLFRTRVRVPSPPLLFSPNAGLINDRLCLYGGVLVLTGQYEALWSDYLTTTGKVVSMVAPSLRAVA